MGKKTIIFFSILALVSLTFLYLYYDKQSPSAITPEVASVADKSGKYLVNYKKEYGPPTIQTYTHSPDQTLIAWLNERDKTAKKDPLCTNCYIVHSQTSYTTSGKDQVVVRETTSHPIGRSIRAYLTPSSDVVVEIFYMCGSPETPCTSEKINQLKEVTNTLQLSQK